uniref:Uncharacterized protein n=1 Tax=Oryza punctata TaxID=4537 RepID=A0A0E0JHH5_ORYPU
MKMHTQSKNIRATGLSLMREKPEFRESEVELGVGPMVGRNRKAALFYTGMKTQGWPCSLSKRKGKDAAAVMFGTIWFDDEVSFDFPMGICATKASHLKLLLHVSIWKPS